MATIQRMTDVLPGLGAGILAGLGVAMPLGAMGVLVVEIGRAGFREGAAAGLGVQSNPPRSPSRGPRRQGRRR